MRHQILACSILFAACAMAGCDNSASLTEVDPPLDYISFDTPPPGMPTEDGSIAGKESGSTCDGYTTFHSTGVRVYGNSCIEYYTEG